MIYLTGQEPPATTTSSTSNVTSPITYQSTLEPPTTTPATTTTTSTTTTELPTNIPAEPFVCPQSDGLFPVPGVTCSNKFWMCSKYYASLMVRILYLCDASIVLEI